MSPSSESEVSEGPRIEDALLRSASRRAGHPAIRRGEQGWTFAELAQRAQEIAGELAQRGVEPGTTVTLYARKSFDAVAALYGVWLAGGVAVPASPELRFEQLSHVVSHSGSLWLIADRRLLDTLDGDASTLATPIRLDALGAAPAPPREHLRGGSTEAIVLYTSGSTGLPKGIVISHDNLLAGARIVSAYLRIGPEDRLLSVLPFHFDYGLNQLLTTVRQGATLVLQPSTHPGAICHALRDHEITGLAGVPPLWAQLLRKGSPLPKMELPALRYMTNSGGAFPVDLLRGYREALPGTEVVLMYGLSEAFRSTYLPFEELDRRPTSMGKAIPETEVFVVDEAGRRCAPGEVGELVHRGPTVALRYHADPETTARVFRPDPIDPARASPVVYSGDRVKADEDGFLYFVGRGDQRLKSYGHRVSPEEVEQLLQGSGLVALAVVGGEKDPVAGDAIVAHVIASRPDLTEAEVSAYCAAKMPRYLRPTKIVFHDDFPRTTSGKVDRRGVLG